MWIYRNYSAGMRHISVPDDVSDNRKQISRCGSVIALSVLGVALTGACGPARQPSSPALRPPSTPAEDPNHRLAVVEAARILTSFVPPAQAKPLDKAPAGTPTALDQLDRPATDNLVDSTRWWIVGGTPATFLDWTKTHRPSGATQFGSSYGHGPADAINRSTLTYYFHEQEPAAALGSQMLIQPATLPSGQTVVRIDAQVTWRPTRPATERIPATATTLTVVTTTAAAPLVTNDPAVIKRVTDLVNALPATLPGFRSCPSDTGARLILRFSTGQSGPVVAEADAGEGGCWPVKVTVSGIPGPGLDGGPDLIRQIDATLGIR
jgi:hypothetical protein